MRFESKTVIVTGGGSGIGLEVAKRFVNEGANVVINGRDAAKLSAAADVIDATGTHVATVAADIAKPATAVKIVEAATERFGGVDILINNAGICLIPQTFEETPDDQFQKVIDVNMWGPFYGIRAFLPQLKTRPEANIVNISSLAGIVGMYGHSAYSMSKAALRGLSQALQSELSGSQVHLTVVHPGGVKTNLIKNAPNLDESLQEKAHRNFTEMSFQTAEKTVRKIIKAVQKNRPQVIIGLDAGLILMIKGLFPKAHPNIIRVLFSQANFKDDPPWKTARK